MAMLPSQEVAKLCKFNPLQLGAIGGHYPYGRAGKVANVVTTFNHLIISSVKFYLWMCEVVLLSVI